MATRLPPPATTVELYLAAILEELCALHALLQPAAADDLIPPSTGELPQCEPESQPTATPVASERAKRRR